MPRSRLLDDPTNLGHFLPLWVGCEIDHATPSGAYRKVFSNLMVDHDPLTSLPWDMVLGGSSAFPRFITEAVV
jgi:hypothetical protein